GLDLLQRGAGNRNVHWRCPGARRDPVEYRRRTADTCRNCDIMSNSAIQTSAGHAADRSAAIGMALGVSSAVAWSTSGFFARMVPIDIWVVVFWRGIFGALSIAALTMIERRRLGFDWQRAFTLGGIGLILISAMGKIAFLYALQNTTVA